MAFRRFAPAGLVLALLLVGAGIEPARAHRVLVFAWAQGDTVHVEAKFGNGKPVRGGAVAVFDPEGAVAAEGVTDDAGEFVFVAPRKTDLTVVLDAGMGHRGEWTVRAEEIASGDGGNGNETARAASAPAKVESSSAETPASPGTDAPESISAVSLRDVERIVDRALDRKLKPVMGLLLESRETGPGATEIFGGIGYIFGIAGVALWFRSRRPREK